MEVEIAATTSVVVLHRQQTPVAIIKTINTESVKWRRTGEAVTINNNNSSSSNHNRIITNRITKRIRTVPAVVVVGPAITTTNRNEPIIRATTITRAGVAAT